MREEEVESGTSMEYEEGGTRGSMKSILEGEGGVRGEGRGTGGSVGRGGGTEARKEQYQ